MKGALMYLMIIWMHMHLINAQSNKCLSAGDPENLGGDILVPHESDCSKFYKCSHGVPVEQQCPGDLYFNPDPQFNYCDYQYNVNCSSNPEQENSTIIYTTTSEHNPEQVSVNQENTTFIYTTTLVHNTEQVPVNQENTTITHIASTIYNTDESCSGNIFYPHSSNCSVYYECVNGKKLLRECPPGLYFHPQRHYCDWPQNVNCLHNSVSA